MGKRVFVVGVGTTQFRKPGGDVDYPELARSAGTQALKDAGVSYSAIEAACVGYCYGDPTSGQRAVYELGLTGVPVFNVNNNCSTGSTALYMARQMVMGGMECTLALGFEKSERGLSQKWDDREAPTKRHFDRMFELPGSDPTPMPGSHNVFTENVVKMFAYAAKEHMDRYGTTREQFSKIAHKNHKQSVNNPNAVMQFEIPLEKMTGVSQQTPNMVHYPLSRFECCPVSDGAAAAVVCSEEFVLRHRLESTAVEILGQVMVTDMPSSFSGDFKTLGGADMASEAAHRLYEQTGLGPRQVDVIELHDCFSSNELITYESLGLCESGNGGKLIDSGTWVKNHAGGEQCILAERWVVNPSGGLLSKGHPIGATGLAQCAELNLQVRGLAGKRQVDGAQVALQHNFGIGGAVVLTMYRRYRPAAQLRASL